MSQDRQGDKAPLERAIERLKSLHEGYAGVRDVVARGREALPALRALLFHTETSGIFEVRCRAISALAALGAFDIIIEFLGDPKDIADPTARVGEEAVISTAARALIGARDERVFPLLMELAQRRLLAGVIEALDAAHSPRAIPAFIRALHEDESRHAAEAALLRLGAVARPALLRAALIPQPDQLTETAMSLRARRSAARLLADIGVSQKERAAVDELVWDPDLEVAFHAARAALSMGVLRSRSVALARLAALLPRLRSPLREAAGDCLAQNSADGEDEGAEGGPG